jgi:hypothetical protein
MVLAWFLTVIAGLDTASRVYPTCGALTLRNSGKPEFRFAIHPLRNDCRERMDARVTRAFTPVFAGYARA